MFAPSMLLTCYSEMLLALLEPFRIPNTLTMSRPPCRHIICLSTQRIQLQHCLHTPQGAQSFLKDHFIRKNSFPSYLTQIYPLPTSSFRLAEHPLRCTMSTHGKSWEPAYKIEVSYTCGHSDTETFHGITEIERFLGHDLDPNYDPVATTQLRLAGECDRSGYLMTCMEQQGLGWYQRKAHRDCEKTAQRSKARLIDLRLRVKSVEANIMPELPEGFTFPGESVKSSEELTERLKYAQGMYEVIHDELIQAFKECAELIFATTMPKERDGETESLSDFEGRCTAKICEFNAKKLSVYAEVVREIERMAKWPPKRPPYTKRCVIKARRPKSESIS
ncbi:hypothetical protein BU24DRAFT_151449 [Aaosphaeria arxii CBS 175.79]|uniref:Uncharacterized protein n=1 Tax=Aaosphaeria arxii CBS 175.79 TaxID=1450172 RepID=A0A6A5XX37_9PLEO|nr:uncharacterized protein BU24DRAFT_151449 [Aaosphaeria arxii CBS 175.79]KAF2017463.1 hypothetical protein BU24DRAFT_151449 [Aaosphaeria arxii CBS 175.79]